MAPEQAQGRRREITTATDVYGLGTILYSLLTGRAAVSRRHRPSRRSGRSSSRTPGGRARWNPGLDQDLETICLKCLEKDAARRYASARALADDLNRWLEGRSILARPVPGWQRLIKLVRRYPAIVALAAAMVIATSLGLAGIFWQWRRAEGLLVMSREQEAMALRSEDRARREAYAATVNLAARDWEDGNRGRRPSAWPQASPCRGRWTFAGSSGITSTGSASPGGARPQGMKTR